MYRDQAEIQRGVFFFRGVLLGLACIFAFSDKYNWSHYERLLLQLSIFVLFTIHVLYVFSLFQVFQLVIACCHEVVVEGLVLPSLAYEKLSNVN